MKLSPPTQRVFWLSVFVMGLGIVGIFARIPFIYENPYWFLVGGYGILFLGNVLKGF